MHQRLWAGRRVLARVAVWLAVAALCLGVAGPRVSAADPPLEHKVKAACLFNFAVNTEWPADAFAGPQAPLVVGLIGEVPFAPLFERGVQNKTAQGRKLEVRRLEPGAQADGCHVVFMASAEEARLEAILATTAAKPMLTVSEVEGFAQRGGIINFIKVEGSVKFEVNTDAAARAGLKLGSQLLKLAVIVKDGSKAKPD
ncbi:MAG: YfiR family protein [Verrucomicrobia bacterium]|nr:YfiR family protein [Verrucomicrobiota bacterium]